MVQDWNKNELILYFRKVAPEFSMESLIVRTTNALIRGGIDTMAKLCDADEEKLIRVRNMGDKSRAFAMLVREKYMQSQ